MKQTGEMAWPKNPPKGITQQEAAKGVLDILVAAGWDSKNGIRQRTKLTYTEMADLLAKMCLEEQALFIATVAMFRIDVTDDRALPPPDGTAVN